MPNRYLLGEGPGSRPHGGWKAQYVSSDGKIVVHYDEEEYDFHIDAAEDYDPAAMRRVLVGIRHFGLELLDEEEMDPEILEDGTIRLYLAPIPSEEYEKLRLVAA